jgi:tetratricopeptide (TPR) repeat protein
MRCAPGWLAGLLAAALTAACMDAETGDAPPAQMAPDASAADNRQLVIARRDLGLGLEAAGDIEGAVDEYIAALSQGTWTVTPESGGFEGTPLGDLARICGRGEPVEQVVRACTRIIAPFRYAPQQLAGFLSNRGDALFRLGESDRALADYNAALEIAGRDAKALLGRGRVRAHSGNHAAALVDFKLATIAMQDLPAPHYARAQSLIALGNTEAAIGAYDDVLATPQGIAEYPDAYRERAALHCAIGQADAAAIGWQVWLAATKGGAGYVQDMLWAQGYLRARITEEFTPTALAALRAWTQAGCPQGG